MMEGSAIIYIHAISSLVSCVLYLDIPSGESVQGSSLILVEYSTSRSGFNDAHLAVANSEVPYISARVI